MRIRGWCYTCVRCLQQTDEIEKEKRTHMKGLIPPSKTIYAGKRRVLRPEDQLMSESEKTGADAENKRA